MAEAIVDIDKLANAITNAVAEAGPVKQIHISRYTAKTPWNPTGSKQRPKMRCRFFQNGFEIREAFVTDEDIDRLNKIRPGRYLNRKVEVIQRNEHGNESMELRYSNATIEQRMELKNEARSLSEMLKRIVSEAGDKAEKK